MQLVLSPRATSPTERTPLVEKVPSDVSRWTSERILILGLSSFNVFIWSLYYTVLVPLLPIYAERYQFGEFEQGVVLACLQLGWFVGLPVVNKTYLKPRTMVYIGAVAYVLAPAIVALHPVLWTICVGRFIEGFGSCLLLVLMTSVMAREIPEDIRGFAFGVRNFIGALGLFAGPLVGGVLYPYGGLRLIMTLLSAISFLGLLAYILLMPDRWFASYEARMASLEVQGISMPARFSAILRESSFSWLFCTHFVAWFLLGLIFMAVPQFMVKELALTSFMTTVFWLLCDISKMIGALVGGYLADAMKPWDVFFGGLSLQHAAQLVLIAVTYQSPTTSWVFLLSCSSVLVFGTTEDGILGPAFMKMITSLETQLSARGQGHENANEERFEEILSTMEFVCAVALTLGPLYAGSVYATLGFAMTLLGFMFFSTIVNICSGCATVQLRYMAPVTTSKV